MPIQTINVTDGQVEYTWPVTLTEINGEDISSDTVQISLGTFSDSGTWLTPVLERPSPSSVTAKLLIDATVPPGTYYPWVRVADAPETVFRRGPAKLIVR